AEGIDLVPLARTMRATLAIVAFALCEVASAQTPSALTPPPPSARAACALPKASDAAKVLLLSAYETEALSSVTIGLQDVATRTPPLHIEPGHEPLYLVAIAFRPTIWRVTGAVERVERVVAAGIMTGPDRSLNDEVPLAGVAGIPAERVHIV